MYGVKAFLIFLGFLVVASAFLFAVFELWKNRRKEQIRTRAAFLFTAFVLFWLFLVSSTYIAEARFHYELWRLSAADLDSIHIGRHDFSDAQTIEEIVGALRQDRWFYASHGGWGDSVPMTLQRHSGETIKIDVALYFREPGAIIGPANRQGLGYSRTQSFVPELPLALKKHGVDLPNCDTAYHRPCTPAQLNP